MQFERLRKNHKKQIIIGAIAVCVIGGTLTFSLTRAKYEIANDLELAKGTINYKAYDFKIMAMYKSDDKTNYTEIEEMPSEGYTINESKSYCNMNNGSKDTTAILKTIDGNHSISKLKKNDKCFIYFDKIISSITIDEIISTLNIKTETPDFSQIATTDEGVFATEDGMYGGTTYYWRGAATTNYLKFAGFCWRIVRINGDKTMRLIYDGTTCHANGTNDANSIAKTSIAYNSSSNQSNYVGWTYTGTSQRTIEGTASNAKTQLELWYSSNIIGTNATKVAQGKYCNDRNASSGATWTINGSEFSYAAITRMSSSSPTLSCPSGDVYTLNVGLITMDEAMYAGGKYTNNTSYYLYNGQNYWTMSPYNWDDWDAEGISTHVFCLNSDGRLGYDGVTKTKGLRPVINLKADTTFSSGRNGAIDSPYIVE